MPARCAVKAGAEILLTWNLRDKTRRLSYLCDNESEMARPAKITTSFPSVLETARRLGVSKHDAMVLSEMAERSEKTGEFIIPGVGRLVRVARESRNGRNPITGEAVGLSPKKVVKYRVARAGKDAIIPPKEDAMISPKKEDAIIPPKKK